MDVVIRSGSKKGHIVSKYQFKVLGVNTVATTPTPAKEKVEDGDFIPFTQANLNTVSAEESVNSESASSDVVQVEEVESSGTRSSKDDLIESLLKKVDDVTSNFIKVQMKLEDTQETYALQLEQEKKESFEEGVQEGLKRAKTDIELANNSSAEQFAKSIQTLEASAVTFEKSLSNIQDDLLGAALDIAKEVIDVEVSEHGSEIALKLANGLIEELKSASKITLKVNPNNHGLLSEKLGKLPHIEIISDSAVNLGGVIVFSDAGNIDAQINKRYERVKEAALSGE